jgi:hypothetical protein
MEIDGETKLSKEEIEVITSSLLMTIENFPNYNIILQEGSTIIEEFLEEIANTPNIDSMDYKSLLECISTVKNKFQERIENNSWCQDVISGF